MRHLGKGRLNPRFWTAIIGIIGAILGIFTVRGLITCHESPDQRNQKLIKAVYGRKTAQVRYVLIHGADANAKLPLK